MAGGGITNDVTAITPQIWSEMVQIPLRKTLVSLEVANVRDIFVGNQIHTPRYADMSAVTYTPGTPITAVAQDWAFDNINVTTYKVAPMYVDDVRSEQVNVSQARELAPETAYQIRNKIDQHVLNNVKYFTSPGVDANSLHGGTAHRPVSATSANINIIFANAKKVLLQNNVEQNGDWCAVITPYIASLVDIKNISTGFNVADSTLRNGYMGNLLGFELYMSNNLPSGKCSTQSATISGAAVSATTCKSIFFGRKKMIDAYIRGPRVSVRPASDRLGTFWYTYATYGSGVNTKNRSRGLNVAVQSSFY